MARLLHIKATPRGDESRTMQLANAFLDAYREAHPDDEIETLDLFDEGLIEFDGEAAAGKYAIMRGLEVAPEAAGKWQSVVEACEHFNSFDKYLLTSPMWNFSIPYRLKQYLDVIVQPTLTFGVEDGGFVGLVGDKPFLVVATRGGNYGPGSGAEAYDFQLPYLKAILGLMGLVSVGAIVAQPIDFASPDEAAATLEKAAQEARAKAAGF